MSAHAGNLRSVGYCERCMLETTIQSNMSYGSKVYKPGSLSVYRVTAKYKDVGKEIYQLEVPGNVKVPGEWTKLTSTKVCILLIGH